MKTTLIDKVLLPGTTWILLLLIPITFFGFYPSYFSQLTAPAPSIIHVHGFMMTIWLAFAIVQPILIKRNRITIHRLVGKISFFLIPLIVTAGYLVLRYSYHRALNGEEVGPPGYYPDDLPAHIKAAEFVVIGSVYWVWLVVYYVLGITFRKNLVAHATFMLAATLTILGPAGDRLIGHICDAMGWPFNALAQNFVFVFVVIVFVSLFALHFSRKLILWPTLLVVATQLTGIFLYYNLPFHPLWNRLASVLFSNQ
jgi:hypothetical protein